MKLGKRPAERSPSDFLLGRYQTAPLPTVPSRFGHGTLFTDWGMLGNDQYGDCVFAGAGHETMLYNKLAKHPVTMSVKGVLGDYGAVTGFRPDDPSTDNGSVVSEVLAWRRRVGVQDETGTRHRIAAYLALDPKDWKQMLQATYIFGAVGIGFEFPGSAMDQFNAGKPWDVVAGASIEGGHYVPVVGSTVSSKRATAVTWARRQQFTRAFYEEYNDEAWAILSLEIMVSGRGLHGIDLAQLKADLAAL